MYLYEQHTMTLSINERYNSLIEDNDEPRNETLSPTTTTTCIKSHYDTLKLNSYSNKSITTIALTKHKRARARISHVPQETGKTKHPGYIIAIYLFRPNPMHGVTLLV